MARKRPRLFSFPREVELQHLATWAQAPDIRDAVTAIVDAFAEIARTKTLPSELLHVLTSACVHPHEQVRSLAAVRLSVATHYFPTALDAFKELRQHPEASVRQTLEALVPNTPLSHESRP